MNGSKKPGPDPERLNIDGDWENRMADAIEKSVPPEGVPDRPSKGTKPRKKKSPDKESGLSGD